MLPKFKMVLRTKYALVVRSLKRLNAHYRLGMTLHKRLPKAAVWGVGNCILTVNSRNENATDLELQPPGMMPPSDEAGRAWNEIGQVYAEIRWISKFEPILIDDQSAYLNTFVDFLRSAETVEIGESVTSEDAKRRDEVSTFLEEHDQLISLTTGQRAERWLEGLGLVDEQPLTELERGVLEAYDEMVNEGMGVTDRGLALRLAESKDLRGKHGGPYSRSYVGKVRHRLMAKGYDLEANSG